MSYSINNIVSKTTSMLMELANKTSSHAEFQHVFASTSINQFTTRVSNLVNLVDCSEYENGSDLEECKRKVKGDLFEVFTVLFFNTFGGDRSLFIQNIEWTERDQEGYDFIAENKDGDPCIIQSKFLSNVTSEFDTNLESFFRTLPEGLKVKKNRPSRVLFTTSIKIGSTLRRSERESGKNFLIVDGNLIKKFTKNNIGFWNTCNGVGIRYFAED